MNECLLLLSTNKKADYLLVWFGGCLRMAPGQDLLGCWWDPQKLGKKEPVQPAQVFAAGPWSDWSGLSLKIIPLLWELLGVLVKILNALITPICEHSHARSKALYAKRVPCGTLHSSVHTYTFSHTYMLTHSSDTPALEIQTQRHILTLSCN